MARRRKIGDVYATPLPDGTYVFGRVLLESSVAFYKHRGKNTNDLPSTEDYEFVVGCYKGCFKEWTFVENRPFDNEDDSFCRRTNIEMEAKERGRFKIIY